MKIKSILALLSVLVFTFACGKATEEDEFNAAGEPSSGHLEGKVAAEDWTYAAGRAKPLAMNPSRLSIDLFGSVPNGDICSFNPGINDTRIQFTVQKTTGTFPLDYSAGQTVNFYLDGQQDPLVSSRGSIWLTDINSRSVTGKLKTIYNENNVVNGQFLVVHCEN
ncbi:MAG: hypothetical protein ACAH59_09505 [Pseudobdellovibrionaceae bacterium]